MPGPPAAWAGRTDGRARGGSLARQLPGLHDRLGHGHRPGREDTQPAYDRAARRLVSHFDDLACSRRSFVAQAADYGHTVSRPESASYPTEAMCPAKPGAMASPRAACGRKLPGPLGHHRADRGTEPHRLAPVAPNQPRCRRLRLRRTAAAVLLRGADQTTLPACLVRRW
jgi:hypothetical protein